jgi:hypothetical protein
VNAHDVDDRISNALHARANQLTEADLRPDRAPAGTSTVHTSLALRWRWGAPLLAAAAVAGLAIGTTVLVTSLKANHAPPASSSSPSVSASPSPSGSGSLSGQGASVVPPPASSASPSVSPSAGTSPVAFNLGYEPLWPFANSQQVAQWQAASRASGAQPWHLDADQTALSFTQGYLGFTDISRVTSHVLDSSGAHVGVGFLNPNGQAVTSAVLHLVRFGADADSPWEVVGSDDTAFSLERPTYGSQVSSPMTVGGHITGVDENIRVSVLAAGASGRAAGILATVPAGGQHSPWSAGPLSFSQTGALTIVASTGGHLQQVERFAIQGAHT